MSGARELRPLREPAFYAASVSTTSDINAPIRAKPSTLARVLGVVGLVLMIVPVGFPMYAAIGLVGPSLIWAVFTAAWVLMFILAIVWIRRRPMLSFAAPFIATVVLFGLFLLADVILDLTA